MEFAIIILLILNVVLTSVMIIKRKDSEPKVNTDEIKYLIANQIERDTKMTDRLISAQNVKMQDLERRIATLNADSERRGIDFRSPLERNMQYISQENSKQLELMRITVSEKLDNALESRLKKSFEIISQNLDLVSKGLGEVKNMAESVGDIKKVLSNVKLRGTWGETQLNMLLEQMLSPSQFERSVKIDKESAEMVDFAIKLPGKDDEEIYLPIDSKFPLDEYEKVLSAYDSLDGALIDKANKGFERAVKEQAKSIASKYIKPPKTTDFAIMYFPLEGIYAEALKRTELNDFLLKERIMICGPSNLGALLNSLQTGFKTLAIEKRSSELWQLLSAFKTEFYKFADILSKVQKKLQEAVDTVDDATKKTRTISRKLHNVAEIDSDKASELLEIED